MIANKPAQDATGRSMQYGAGIGLVLAISVAGAQERTDFNAYVLKATEQLVQTRGGMGYARSASLSRDIPFGKNAVLSARNPPYTMCVSAMLETIVTALTIYAEETGDYRPFDYLPKKSWTRLSPVDLRGQIWIVARSQSLGTAHALQNFGIGTVTDFRNVEPGAFINLNRTNRSGHAVVFLGYLDKQGKLLPRFSNAVAGFKYFSSQGGRTNGGFGYRYAFFSDAGCPQLPPGRKRDCGVIRSSISALLHAGTMTHPAYWNKAQALEQLEREAFHMKNGDTAMLMEGDYDSGYFSGKTTDD